MHNVRLLDAPFVPSNAMADFDAAHVEAGAIVSFTGKVRPAGDVAALELSHYPPLTLPGMQTLAADAKDRFVCDGVLVWHRTGTMRPGDPIVLVAAAARHRRSAFEAADYLMDHLKSAAWFWKRELRGGVWHWIEPREDDHRDLARWTPGDASFD